MAARSEACGAAGDPSPAQICPASPSGPHPARRPGPTSAPGPHPGSCPCPQECADTLLKEIDYIAEGRNADRFRRNFREQGWVKVPRVYWQYT